MIYPRSWISIRTHTLDQEKAPRARGTVHLAVANDRGRVGRRSTCLVIQVLGFLQLTCRWELERQIALLLSVGDLLSRFQLRGGHIVGVTRQLMANQAVRAQKGLFSLADVAFHWHMLWISLWL